MKLTAIRFDQIARDLARYGFLVERDNGVIAVYCGAPAPVLIAERNGDVLAALRAACRSLRPELGERAYTSLMEG